MDWPLPPLGPGLSVFVTNAELWRQKTGLPTLGTSAVWSVANASIYCPIVVRSPMLVRKLYAANGAAVSGNCAIALFNAPFGFQSSQSDSVSPKARLAASGAVAQAGTNVWQEFDVTDVWIAPGFYFLAYGLDNTTGQVLRLANIADVHAQMAGVGGSAHFPVPALDPFVSLGIRAGISSLPMLALGGIA